MTSLRMARRCVARRRALALVCSLGLTITAASAQTASKGDAKRGEARAAACASCHGTPDRPPLERTPALAGQQREFLVLQMFLFREGLRDVPPMAGVLKGYTDADLTDVAAYFANQKPLSLQKGKPDPKRYARGAELAAAMGCGSCHIQDYRGQNQVPRIVNQREDYLVGAMTDYRDNRRSGTDTSMNGALYRVSDADIQALAHYLAHYPGK